MIQKIYIAGALGSGKTTYAARLSKTNGITVFSLDDIFWDNTGKIPKKRSDDLRKKLLNQVLKENKSWIIEGASFSDYIDDAIKSADEVHIIKTNKWVRIYRMIKRYIKRKLRIEKSLFRPTLHGLWRDIIMTYNYDKDILPIILTKANSGKPNRMKTIKF